MKRKRVKIIEITVGVLFVSSVVLLIFCINHYTTIKNSYIVTSNSGIHCYVNGNEHANIKDKIYCPTMQDCVNFVAKIGEHKCLDL